MRDHERGQVDPNHLIDTLVQHNAALQVAVAEVSELATVVATLSTELKGLKETVVSTSNMLHGFGSPDSIASRLTVLEESHQRLGASVVATAKHERHEREASNRRIWKWVGLIVTVTSIVVNVVMSLMGYSTHTLPHH